MYTGLLHTHSGLRWLVLLAIVLCIVKCIPGLSGKKSWTSGEMKLSTLAVRLTHLQLLIGGILYFISPRVQFSANTMSNEVLRFYTVEHVTMMLIAVALITIGNARAKKREGAKAFKAVFWFFLAGLIVMLASIPWPFREALGGNWF